MSTQELMKGRRYEGAEKLIPTWVSLALAINTNDQRILNVSH